MKINNIVIDILNNPKPTYRHGWQRSKETRYRPTFEDILTRVDSNLDYKKEILSLFRK